MISITEQSAEYTPTVSLTSDMGFNDVFIVPAITVVGDIMSWVQSLGENQRMKSTNCAPGLAALKACISKHKSPKKSWMIYPDLQNI